MGLGCRVLKPCNPLVDIPRSVSKQYVTAALCNMIRMESVCLLALGHGKLSGRNEMQTACQLQVADVLKAGNDYLDNLHLQVMLLHYRKHRFW